MKVFAMMIVIAGLVIAVAPQYSNCDAQSGTIPTATTTVASTTSVAATVVPKMKCLWSARGALAVGISLAATGALLFFARRKETRRALSIVGALLGLFAVLLPTALIGTCGQDAMVCNTTMKPIMLAAGGLAVAASVLVLVFNELQRDEAAGEGTDPG